LILVSLAALNMYDLPALRLAIEDFWAGLRARLKEAGVTDVPERLVWDPPGERLWLAPELLFAQTCGYPLTHALAGKVRLVATPRYRLPDIEGPFYCSRIVVREDSAATSLADLRGARAAYNGSDSQSGYSAPRLALAPLAKDGHFLGGTVESGAHLNSMAMVARGEADLCAVDGVLWELVARHEPERIEGLRVLASTEAAPNLPYITARSADDELVGRLRDGLASVMVEPRLAAAREALLIDGIDLLPLTAYDRIMDMERRAAEMGYATLA
jgi:ABC-type phosphate/phosphonate transport system substrate-binding protein